MSLLLLAFGLVLAAFAEESYAQTILDGSTPSGATPGAPAGSDALSELENINLFNGHLNLHVPMLGIGGRGDAQAAIMLAIDNHWSVKTETHYSVTGSKTYQYIPVLNGGPVVKPGYGPGLLVGRMAGEVDTSSSCGDIYNPYSDYVGALTRLTIVLPDGTEYELRDQLSGGRPLLHASSYPCHETGANRGRVFVSADGSAATFISDSDIRDAADTRSTGVLYPTGYLMLRDGTKLRIEGGAIRWLRDRNGNSLSFNYVPTGPNFWRVQDVTDALGRTISVTYDFSDVEPYGLCDRITYKGFGGTDQIIRISKSNLHNALRSDFSIKTDIQLFPGSSNGATVDPIVTTSLWLPNGQRYKFYYDSYVEVARVDLPTGGAVEYDYGGLGEPGNSGFFFTYPDDGNSVIYRRLIERRVSANGSSWEGKTQYGVYETGNQAGFPLGVSYIYVNHLEQNDHVGSAQVHYFNGSALDSMVRKRPTDYSPWKEGREFKTEFYEGGEYGVGETPVTPIRVVTREWAQRAPVTWWRSAYPTLNVDGEPPNDPRLLEVTTTIMEPIMSEPGVLITKQRFDYDLYNNLTDVYDYSYSTEVPESFYRHTHTGYLTVNPQNGIDYTSTDVHIRNLQTSQIIYANGVQETVMAASETVYDENAYAPLNYGAVSGWIDPGSSARGNVTTTRTWLNMNGGAPSVYPAGTYLLNHVQYDQCGNARNLWDAKGKQLSQSYDDAFSDGLPRNTYALLTLTVSPPVPDPSQPGTNINLVTSRAYDFSTGLQVSETDPNGRTTTYSYDDPLSRLKSETRPLGGGTTSYEYGDTPGSIYVRTLTSQNASQTIDDYQTMDGLGRASRSLHYRGNSTYETSDVLYDFMGRIWKVSNPYLSSGPGSNLNPSDVWSKTLYDSLGRVTKATKPDGSEITTSYTSSIEAECIAIKVTDAAGRARRQLKDAFGRTAAVDEPNESGDLGDVEDPVQRTRYSYSVLDNLVEVNQFDPALLDVQRRTFVFDSLARLVSATNPETGTINYRYDENGNLVKRTDARGVVTTNVYDPLNRIVSQSYSDATPLLTYVYDSTAVDNAKGRLVSASSSVASSQYNGYDLMGRPLSITQTLDGHS